MMMVGRHCSAIAQVLLAVSCARRVSGQTSVITQANIYDAVAACLNEDPVGMDCPNAPYGTAANWDVSGVTDFSYLLSASGYRPGGGVDCTQFVGGSVFASWDMSGATTTQKSACRVAHSLRACLCALCFAPSCAPLTLHGELVCQCHSRPQCLTHVPRWWTSRGWQAGT